MVQCILTLESRLYIVVNVSQRCSISLDLESRVAQCILSLETPVYIGVRMAQSILSLETHATFVDAGGVVYIVSRDASPYLSLEWRSYIYTRAIHCS